MIFINKRPCITGRFLFLEKSLRRCFWAKWLQCLERATSSSYTTPGPSTSQGKLCCHLKYSSKRDKVLWSSSVVWFNLYGSFTNEWTQGDFITTIIVSGILFLLSTHQNSICPPPLQLLFSHPALSHFLSLEKAVKLLILWGLHAFIIAFLPRKPLPAFCTMLLTENFKTFFWFCKKYQWMKRIQ